jgi:MFS transporter, FHS family, glucose/mannose:H+ symporter
VTRVHTNWLTVSAYSGMFGFGIVMALLGAILPLISQRLQFDLAHAGSLFLAMNGAMLVTTVSLGPLLDRFGLRPALGIAPLFVGAALVLIAGTGSFNGLVAAVVLLGIGGGALNQATNTLVADLHADAQRKSAALNLLGVFYGVGALFIPFSIGFLLNRLGLSPILYLAAGLSLVTSIICAVLGFPPPRQAAGVPPAAIVRLASQPLVVILALLLLFQSGNEFILGGYMTTHLVRNLDAPVTAASYLLAAYWAAIMLMRIVLSRILLHISGHILVLASALGVAASTALLILAPSRPVAALAVVLIGASIAAIFPTTLGLAGTRYASHSGTVFGILIGVALTGGMILPWVAGWVSQSHGIRAGLAIVVGNAMAICCLQLAAIRETRNHVS